jgi:hypothetical protein
MPNVGHGEEQIRADETVSLSQGYLQEIFDAWEFSAVANSDRIDAGKHSNWEEEKQDAVLPYER